MVVGAVLPSEYIHLPYKLTVYPPDEDDGTIAVVSLPGGYFVPLQFMFVYHPSNVYAMVRPFTVLMYTVLDGPVGLIFHPEPLWTPEVAAGTFSGFRSEV